MKTLTLDTSPVADRADDTQSPENDDRPPVLAHLPALPRLEALDLHDTQVGDQDLRPLGGFPRLTSLDLSGTLVSDVGLAKLAPLESLEPTDRRRVRRAGLDRAGWLAALVVHPAIVG
ncbi:MAG TPA: hypothetical protein VGX78_02265, partial [Pirellulales bacterium]|nr:hypothetical protein [Pirellulales bacterium]